MNKTLPARPHLDHLKGQAKTLLAQLKQRDRAARLADAQRQIARENGFASWPALTRHVEQLRALEGDWRFARLEIDGVAVAESLIAHSRILIDGDRFRTESPEADYEGIFTIDAEARPPHIDIEMVAGPDAGETCHGIFQAGGDELTLCLGLPGRPRPEAFATRAGSGHALETLLRVSKARPENVKGGTPAPRAAEPEVERADPKAFEGPITALMKRLAGEWAAVELVTGGRRLPGEYLAHASRTMKGNEVKVVVGGQTMVHAKVRIDERACPIAVDYLDLKKGGLTRGIMDWVGEEARFLMAPAGAPRPTSFEDEGTLSRWKKR